MSLFKLPRLPQFDPDKDGNPFAWIVANAPKARAARATAQAVQRAQLNPRPARPHAQVNTQAGQQEDGRQAAG